MGEAARLPEPGRGRWAVIAAGETILPRRVHPQPTPNLVPGGDCGACVLAGALGMTPERVYDELVEKRTCIGHGEMCRLLRVAISRGLADRIIEEPAEWPGSWSQRSFGRPAHLEHLPWISYVRMAIDAGYYGLAEVDFARGGGGTRVQTDHWVLIRGVRSEGHPVGKVMTGEVLVSCSARSTGGVDEWVEAVDFLKNRGGYNLLFVRLGGGGG